MRYGESGRHPTLRAQKPLRSFGFRRGMKTCQLHHPSDPSTPNLLHCPLKVANRYLWQSCGARTGSMRWRSSLALRHLVQQRQRRRSVGLSKTYEDPQFREHSKYASFIKRLYDLHLVDVSLSVPEERVSIFFVKKKGGRLRMIVDCRLANTHFVEPEGIRLASADSLSKMEIPEGSPLYLATADLQNAFYTMGMPESLRQFFGLRRVRAADLGVQEVEGKPVSPGQWVHPRVAVIPMGWSHAMWWCQRLSEKLVEDSGLTKKERLRDFDPAPPGNFWHVEYVDNLVVFGTVRSEVERRFWLAVQALRDAGLTVHEIEYGEGQSKVLGWSIDEKGTVGPTLSRLWRVRQGIREILRRGRASGQQLERLVGHMTFISLCRRESLSVLGDVYTFIKRHYSTVVPLWKSVRRELAIWDGVSPLIHVNMKTPWKETLYAVDASDWGMGVTTSTVQKPLRWGGMLKDGVFGMFKLGTHGCMFMQTIRFLGWMWARAQSMVQQTRQHVFQQWVSMWLTDSGLWWADTDGSDQTVCLCMKQEPLSMQFGMH